MTETIDQDYDYDDDPGTDLVPAEVVEAEIVPTALTEKEAKSLDRKIRAASEKIGTNIEALMDLLETAALGQIHVALGLPSWTAYVKDAVNITVTSRIERKQIAALMSGKGVSQRVIASVLGVSQKTVDRDLEGSAAADGDGPAEVTGLDGKSYKKTHEPRAPRERDDDEPQQQKTLLEDLESEVFQLVNDVESLRELVEDDDRFDDDRPQLAQAPIVNETLREAIDDLMALYAQIVNPGD